MTNKKPTIYDIKYLTRGTSPHFFTRQTMKFFGQTMKSFSVYKTSNSNVWRICAEIRNPYNGKQMGLTERWFDARTNELLLEMPTE